MTTVQTLAGASANGVYDAGTMQCVAGVLSSMNVSFDSFNPELNLTNLVVLKAWYDYGDGISRDIANFLENGGSDVILGVATLGMATWANRSSSSNAITASPGTSTPTRENLTGSLDKLTADERKVVEGLLASGKNVEIIPRSSVQGIKTPDFFVDGVKTELKTLNGTSLNTPVKRITEGFNQGASSVIIDGRKAEITMQDAENVVDRVIGKLVS